MSDFNKFTYATNSTIAPSRISVVRCRIHQRLSSNTLAVELAPIELENGELEAGKLEWIEPGFVFDTEAEAEAAMEDAVIDMFHTLKICWNCKHAKSYAPDISCEKDCLGHPIPEMYNNCKDWERKSDE